MTQDRELVDLCGEKRSGDREEEGRDGRRNWEGEREREKGKEKKGTWGRRELFVPFVLVSRARTPPLLL